MRALTMALLAGAGIALADSDPAPAGEDGFQVSDAPAGNWEPNGNWDPNGVWEPNGFQVSVAPTGTWDPNQVL